MKRYFGLSNREENFAIHNAFFNSLLNVFTAVPLIYFGYCVIKLDGIKDLVLNYNANTKVWNYSIIVYGSFKLLSFLFETYFIGKASLNLVKAEKNHNNF